MADGIGRASAFLASGTIVSRILGFVKVAVFGFVIGQQGQGSDAFSVANQLPNTVYVIVAGGVLTAILVPQIVRSAMHADGGTAYINKLLTVALVVLLSSAAVATALAAPITALVSDFGNPGQLELAIAFAYWCMPQIFFYGLYTVLGEVLNARRSFGPFTWVPVLNNVVAIAGLGLFALLFGADPHGSTRVSTDYTAAMIAVLAGSATLGVIVQALSLGLFWRRIGLRYRPDFHWRGVGLRTTGKLAGWTFGMLLLTTAAGIVETRVVSLASGENASVTMLGTAWLIFMLPHSVITVSIATAYFTRMAEHVAGDRMNGLRDDVSSAIRGISVIIVLAAAGIAVLAYPFARLFVTEFSQVQALGNLIIAYILGLVAFCILFVLQRAFYALGDTRTPFFFTLAQVILVVIGVVFCAALPLEWIAVGVALVVSITGTIQMLIAAVLLRRRLGTIDGRRIVVSLAKDAAAIVVPIVLGLVLLVAFGGTTQGGFAVSGFLGAAITMAVVAVVMTAVYAGGLLVLRSAEFRTVLDPILARIRRR